MSPSSAYHIDKSAPNVFHQGRTAPLGAIGVVLSYWARAGSKRYFNIDDARKSAEELVSQGYDVRLVDSFTDTTVMEWRHHFSEAFFSQFHIPIGQTCPDTPNRGTPSISTMTLPKSTEPEASPESREAFQ